MKKLCCLILLLSLIFLTSISVKATEIDVSPDNYVNSNSAIVAQRLATMQLFSDALLQGSSSFEIDNNDYSSLDEYLDDIYNIVIDSPLTIPALGYTEVSQLKDSLNQRCLDLFNWIEDTLDSAILNSPSLTDFFDWLDNNNKASNTDFKEIFNIGKGLYQIGLSQSGENTPQPNPSPDYSFISLINTLFYYDASGYNGKDFFTIDNMYIRNTLYQLNDLHSFSYQGTFVGYINGLNRNYHIVDTSNRMPDLEIQSFSPLITININTSNENNVIVSYSSNSYASFIKNVNNTLGRLYYYQTQNVWSDQNRVVNYNQSSFQNLSSAINYIYDHYFNVNIYVDGVPWVLVNNTTLPSSFNLGGQTIINNYNYPIEYKFSEPTNIDYDKLYQIIKRAFDNGTSTNITTINNGDVYINSNNETVYPSLNLDVPDLDTDLISTFLKYTAIPFFASELIAPLNTYQSDVLTVVATSTSVIPNDIKVVFGCILAMLLFVFVMHRLLE